MDRLEAMQMFVRVAEAGSFIAVANQMQVARSIVTRQVAALEKHLGTKLITRSTRSLTLTAAGASYLEKCRVILNMVDSTEASLHQEKTLSRGRIRLGLPLTFGLQELLPELLAFTQAQPHIELIMDFSDQKSNLIEEGLDLAIRITATLQPGDIVRSLGKCRLLTFASPGYLSQYGKPKHPSELAQHACLIYSNASTHTTWQYQESGKPLQASVRGRLVANNGLALTEAAAQGLGITRQPDFIAAPYLAQGRVKQVLKEFESEPLGIYAVLPSNRYIPHRVSALIEHVVDVLKRKKAQ